MSCLIFARRWAAVVALGRRLNELCVNLPAAADASYPLIIHAQKAITQAAAIEATRFTWEGVCISVCLYLYMCVYVCMRGVRGGWAQEHGVHAGISCWSLLFFSLS